MLVCSTLKLEKNLVHSFIHSDGCFLKYAFLGSTWLAKWGFDESAGDWSRRGGLPSEEKSIPVSYTHTHTLCFYFLLSDLISIILISSPTGVLTCCSQRSPSPWASAAPPATLTRYLVARCHRMTITPRSWVSGEENQGARGASSFSVPQNSTLWWGRWLAGTESLELTPGLPKVSCKGTEW